MCPHKMAGQLESNISENICPWAISIVCSGDCYWLLIKVVCSCVLVCSGISMNPPKGFVSSELSDDSVSRFTSLLLSPYGLAVGGT